MPILEAKDEAVKAMKGLHVYHAGISNCSMRVRMVLEEKGIPWESHLIDLGRQENLKDWYLAINPKGLVPAIIDNGVVVTESNDIMLYLEKEYPEPPLLPDEIEASEKVEYWVNLASEIHISAIKTYVYGTTGGATKSKEDMDHYRQIQPDKKLIEFHEHSLKGFQDVEIKKAAEQVHEVFTEIDMQLARQKWIVGDEVTLADIAWIPQYVLLGGLGFPFDKYKNVQLWAIEFKKRDSYKKGVEKWLPSTPFWLLRIFFKIKKLLKL